MTATLWCLRSSPWSVRARWGLKIIGFDYQSKNILTTLLAEWRMRIIFRRWRVTVPALVDGDTTIMDGPELVEYAQAHMGDGAPQLFRQGVREWIEVANEVMENERANDVQLAIIDDEKLKALFPPAMRWIFEWFGGFAVWLIRCQVKSFNKKYPKRYNEEELKAALTRIRTGIQTSSSGYLVGNSFSFADIACTTAIETVLPAQGKHIIDLVPPHQGFNFPMDELCAWRDKMHAKHWVEGI